MSRAENQAKIAARRPTWAEIDLNNLAANFHRVRRRVTPVARIMAVLKANAYGHGAVECAQRLSREGADWFGVALPEEGTQLRGPKLVGEGILCGYHRTRYGENPSLHPRARQ